MLNLSKPYIFFQWTHSNPPKRPELQSFEPGSNQHLGKRSNLWSLNGLLGSNRWFKAKAIYLSKPFSFSQSGCMSQINPNYSFFKTRTFEPGSNQHFGRRSNLWSLNGLLGSNRWFKAKAIYLSKPFSFSQSGCMSPINPNYSFFASFACPK